MTDEEKVSSEKFTVSGDKLVEKVKQLIHEGNIRRVRLIYKDKTVFDIPLSIGAPAAAAIIMAAPVLAADRSVVVIAPSFAEATALAEDLGAVFGNRVLLGASGLGNAGLTRAWSRGGPPPPGGVVGSRAPGG